ncbi:Fatty-acid amide hydrolase 1 [Orchesella cincta]|uniref:Fatty-acid amide hydrolase 1 n=1 Tax=Orchesella cincta TaxID=48709 RepID=A0A1D2NK99_ORCCI|nr:Fatty-acid amide hydrolase 1 [Orchesella cincta]
MNQSIFGLYWADTGKNLLKEFDGEPLSKSGMGLVRHANMPAWLRKLLGMLLTVKALPIHSKTMKELIEVGIGYQSLEQFTDCVNHLNEVREGILKKMEEEHIDLLLGPVMPFPSIEESVTNLFAMASIYTFIWNALDMPAGVVRFGKEGGKLIDQMDTQNDNFLEMAKNAVPASIGLPINVQVIGKPFQEELVLRLLCELEDCYNKQARVVPKLSNGASNGITTS